MVYILEEDHLEPKAKLEYDPKGRMAKLKFCSQVAMIAEKK